MSEERGELPEAVDRFVERVRPVGDDAVRIARVLGWVFVGLLSFLLLAVLGELLLSD